MHIACPSITRNIRLLAFVCSLLLPAVVAAAPANAPSQARFASRQGAFAAATAYAAANQGSVFITSGTPSMEPLIHGKTYAVIQKVPYGTIANRDILVYAGQPAASSPATETMLHRAVQHDKFGWIMSGDNNRWSESWYRVTPANYIGRVVALFGFPQV